MSSPRAHASRSLAMRPRTIAKHELVGMGSTSSQMSKRDWKPLRSPRNQKTQPADVEPPMRSPRPRNQAKAETTASLIMVNGNSMVKTYRLVSDMQRENAERPSMEGGSVLTMAHLQKLCSLYAQLCEDDMRGMVTLEQLTAIVRGALGMEEERFTPRIFRVADPRGSGRIDFPRFFVELMMPVSVTGLVKLHYIFTSLSINPRDHEGTLPSVARGEIEGILGYAAKVQQYYLQWADEVFASMEGYPIAGLSSRHRCILKRDLEAATARQPLLSICLGKCLETERHIVESLTNVQDQTNELVKLANMGITSMMETTSLATAEQPIFTFENLQQLWIHFKEKLDYQGPEKQTEKPAPILEHDQFVDIMDSFFPDGTTKQVTRGGFVSVQAIDPQAEQKAAVRLARRQQIGVLFDLVDKMNGLQRVDLRELFAQMSKGIPAMTTAQRRDWWFEIYLQPGKRDGTSVLDFIDLAQLLERGAVELREQADFIKQWCAECETLDTSGQRLCDGAKMLASAEATPRVKHAIAMLLECSL